MATEVRSRAELLEMIRDILADIVDQESLRLTEATTADEVADWDSINHVKLILGLEQELGIRFDTEEIEDLSNVGQFIDLIQTKRGR